MPGELPDTPPAPPPRRRFFGCPAFPAVAYQVAELGKNLVESRLEVGNLVAFPVVYRNTLPDVDGKLAAHLHGETQVFRCVLCGAPYGLIFAFFGGNQVQHSPGVTTRALLGNVGGYH